MGDAGPHSAACRRRRKGLVRAGTAVLIGAAVVGCGPAPRPPPREWSRVWAAERARLPKAAELEGAGAHAACEQLLVATREARQTLLPAPDEALDRTVEDWIERAGGLAFDCPGAQGDAAAVRSAIDDLDQLAAEIEAALGAERSARPLRPQPPTA